MSCCVPCKAETVYENRKQEKKEVEECKKRLEATEEELKKAQAEAQAAKDKLEELNSKSHCCPTIDIESISKVGNEALVTFSDGTYMTVPLEFTHGLDAEKPFSIMAKLSKRIDDLDDAVKGLSDKLDAQSKLFVKLTDLVKINSCGEEAPFLGVDVKVAKEVADENS
nr:MAG TPA: hypothetical protein [Caudoviricetes sp.]